MKITIGQLQGYVKNLLGMMREEVIFSLSDLEKRMGEIIFIDEDKSAQQYISGKEQQYISLGLNRQANICIINYVDPRHNDDPLVITINKDSRSSQITVKATVEIPGYSSLITDHFRNIVQDKTIPTIDLPEIRKELEKLLELSYTKL